MLGVAPTVRLPVGVPVRLGLAVPELVEGTGAPPTLRTAPLSKLMRRTPEEERR